MRHKPNPTNPRRISPEASQRLQRSLQEFGDLGGIVINQRSGRMIGGHQRAASLGWKDVLIHNVKTYAKPTATGTVMEGTILDTATGTELAYRQVDWPLEKEKRAMVAANKHGGEFDELKLSKLVSQLKGFTPEVMGFSKEEAIALAQMRVAIEEKIPEAPETVKVTQIFLQAAQHARFLKQVAVLGKAYKTQGLTDTIRHAIQKECRAA